MIRRVALLMLVTALVFVAAPAQGQVPSIPETPDPPPELVDAYNEVATEAAPFLFQVSDAIGPAVNAGGFALRPACSAIGTGAVVIGLAGAAGVQSPFEFGSLTGPVFISCANAFLPGPADPGFEMIDAEAGPTIEVLIDPVLGFVWFSLKPARADLEGACGGLAIASGPPEQVPPPLNRFSVLGTVCDF